MKDKKPKLVCVIDFPPWGSLCMTRKQKKLWDAENPKNDLIFDIDSLKKWTIVPAKE